ncbi:hypothetical protein [Afipia sp. Root123D2]|uniref:hypothetical protein n=1 Tax=Afipia sp. Root123D2 TaxID=1736436 RepID=UPI001FCCFAB9|nr:hypothetical protein [Afipia sp. Root123D2]
MAAAVEKTVDQNEAVDMPAHRLDSSFGDALPVIEERHVRREAWNSAPRQPGTFHAAAKRAMEFGQRRDARAGSHDKRTLAVLAIETQYAIESDIECGLPDRIARLSCHLDKALGNPGVVAESMERNVQTSRRYRRSCQARSLRHLLASREIRKASSFEGTSARNKRSCREAA